MKKITLTANNTFEHQWIDGLHTMPANVIEVTDDVFNILSQDRNKTYDKETKVTGDYITPFVLVDAQNGAEKRIEASRNAAMFILLNSVALGSAHDYSVTPTNNNFLNNLITLGNGSKFTCIDNEDIKMRRFHTDAQLRTLALDIETHISAQFDTYEIRLGDISDATTQAELDAIVW